MQSPDPASQPDFTDAQIQELLSTAWARVKKLIEGMELANKYYGEGGYDRETWDRICDGLSRESMSLMMMLSIPAHPDLAKDCEQAVREAAGIAPREGGMREALSQQVAQGLLMSVMTTGRHHMVEPAEWPMEMPAAVLGAVRSAEGINSDPTMANLRDTGFGR